MIKGGLLTPMAFSSIDCIDYICNYSTFVTPIRSMEKSKERVRKCTTEKYLPPTGLSGGRSKMKIMFFSADDRQAAEALDFMNGFYPFGWECIQELFWRSAVPIQQRQFVQTLKNKTKYNSLALGLLFVPHPKILLHW